ncbi:rhodanese-like domain-containing protein [Isosphaeraceae bacterium EP7]
MAESRFGVGLCSPDDLKKRLDEGQPLVLLDVREDDERNYCAIAAPVHATDLHVPMGSIQESYEQIREVAETAPVFVYCHHGMRSMTVARWLAGRGLTGVHNLEGGIDAWSQGIDPGVRRY